MEKKEQIQNSDFRADNVRRESNSYKMLFVKLVHFALDTVLFYFAFIWFRYESFFDLNPVGFRYNYFVTIGYAVLLYCICSSGERRATLAC